MKRLQQAMRVLFAVGIAVLFLLPVSRSKAESSARFSASLYAAAYGEQVTVKAQVTSEQTSEWILKTADGQELGRESAGGGKTGVSFTFPVTRALPHCTVLQLFCADSDAPLCEAQLFCDQRRNGALHQVATDRKCVAITFDAANSPANTDKILDLLDRYDAKATFFVIGEFALVHPDVCERIVARGHELASHSYEHLEMRTATLEQAYKSLTRTDALLRTFNGDTRVLYRPPSGASTFRDRAIARGLGTEVIQWSVDSGDGFADSTESGVQYRIKTHLHNGGIVLMHVYGKHTMKALETLLPYYQQQGYAFVTVSELLLNGESYIDAYGTQRALHTDAARVAPIAEKLSEGR